SHDVVGLGREDEPGRLRRGGHDLAVRAARSTGRVAVVAGLLRGVGQPVAAERAGRGRVRARRRAHRARVRWAGLVGTRVHAVAGAWVALLERCVRRAIAAERARAGLGGAAVVLADQAHRLAIGARLGSVGGALIAHLAVGYVAIAAEWTGHRRGTR